MTLIYERRIRALEEQHDALEKELRALQSRYASDHEIEVLKKKKLRIKDKIAYLSCKERND